MAGYVRQIDSIEDEDFASEFAQSHTINYGTIVQPGITASTELSDRLPKRTILCFRVSFLNVLLVGLGFMLNLGAYTTAAMAQTVVLSSVNDDYFQGSPTFGYVLWAISCGTGIFAYLSGPSVVAAFGPKIPMVAGSFCVALYIAAFIRPLTITLYVGAVLLGIGSNLMWQVEAHFITINSTTKRVTSLVFGNLFYFFMVDGVDVISSHTRVMIFSILTAVSLLGGIVLTFVVHPWTEKIPRPPTDYSAEPFTVSWTKRGVWFKIERCFIKGFLLLDALIMVSTNVLYNLSITQDKQVALVRTLISKDMLKLVPFFLYLGLEGTFWQNVYGTSLGYTGQFGDLRQALVGLTGVFSGLGEIVAGLLLGTLGKWMHYNGKDGVLMCGMVLHIVAFYLTFLNIPEAASIAMTNDLAFIQPNQYIAMVVSFLFGLGDGIYGGQVTAYLGSKYRHDCVSVFAVYQLWSSVANTISFSYATVLTLPYQLAILVISSIIGAAGFCLLEWKALNNRSPE